MYSGGTRFLYPPRCNNIRVENETITLADPDVFYPNYQGIIVVAPYSCGAGGWSIVGPMQISTQDGAVTLGQASVAAQVFSSSNSSVALKTFVHEYSHSFNLGHADHLNCGAAPIAAAGCTIVSHFDVYSVMGTAIGLLPNFNAPELEFLGWLTPTHIQTVTQSGTYTLEPLETTPTGLKALKIPRPANGYVYVEYRRPLAADAVSPFPTELDGALIHLDNPSTLAYGYETLLVDAKRGTSGFDSALPVGQSLTDPVSGVTIRTVDANPRNLTVDVMLPGSPTLTPTPTPPSPTPTPSASPPSSTCTDPPSVFLGTAYTAPCPTLSVDSPTVQLTGSLIVRANKGTAAYIYRGVYISEGSDWKFVGRAFSPGDTTYADWATTAASFALSPQSLGLSAGMHYIAAWDWTYDPVFTCWKGPGSSVCYDASTSESARATAGKWRVQQFNIQ